MSLFSREPKPRNVRIGDRQFLTSGLNSSFWADAFHNSMTVPWPVFFLGFAIYFVSMNSIFALLYYLGEDAIANARPHSLADMFYFSIETLATVGYGDMHPRTDYAHLVATVEIFAGMSTLAVFTGLIFARFSRPRARVIFANSLTLAQHNGQKMLMARLANARHSSVNEAQANVWLLYWETTKEGVRFRRFKPLKLMQSRNPTFAFSWTLFHPVDETSPIYGMDVAAMEAIGAYFVVIFDGLDDASGQRVNVPQGYSAQDIRLGHVFADILTTAENGLPQLNYDRIHDTEEQVLEPVVKPR